MLPFLLESLSNNKLPRGILFEILEEIVNNIASNIQPQRCELFWKTCITILNNLSQKWVTNRREDIAENLELILKLIGEAMEYRNGKLLQMPVPLVQMLLSLLTLSDLPEAILLVISQISVLLLTSKNIRLPQEQASTLTRKMLCVPKQILLHFVYHVMDYISFEALILPTFLKHCLDSNLDNESLHVLTQLVLKKSPLSVNGINLESWTKYCLDFSSRQNNKKIHEILIKHLFVEDDSLIRNMDKYMCALICLPHLILDNEMKIEMKVLLDKNLELLCENIKVKSADDLKILLFLLLNTIECIVHTFAAEDLVSHVNLMFEIVLPLSCNVKLITALQIIDLYLSALKNETKIISMDVLKKLHSILEENFNSPYHEVLYNHL